MPDFICPNVEVVEKVTTEIDIAESLENDDLFGVRDPTIAAFCLCQKQKLVGIRLYRVVRFNRSPERVVQFEFAGRKEAYSMAHNAMYDIRSSLEIQNVNFGELFLYLRNLRTQIKSFI